jgi:hypothetical protein
MRCCVALRCSCQTSRDGLPPAIRFQLPSVTEVASRCVKQTSSSTNIRNQYRLQQAVASPTPLTLRSAQRAQPSSPERGRGHAHRRNSEQDQVGDRPHDLAPRQRRPKHLGQPHRLSPTGQRTRQRLHTHPSPARGRSIAAASQARSGHIAATHPLRSPASGAAPVSGEPNPLQTLTI